eukprot:694260-Rhodomonas_salina.1
MSAGPGGNVPWHRQDRSSLHCTLDPRPWTLEPGTWTLDPQAGPWKTDPGPKTLAPPGLGTSLTSGVTPSRPAGGLDRESGPVPF